MKKLLVVLVLLTFHHTFSQEKKEFPQDNNKNHEIKVDVTNYWIWRVTQLNYEYILNKHNAIGLNVLFKIGEHKINDYIHNFSFNPYYRRYFLKNRKARGPFFEGFLSINQRNDDYNTKGRKTNFGTGLGIGNKFVFKNSILFELNLNFGLNIFRDQDPWRNEQLEDYLFPRVSLSIGYRF